MVVDIRYRWNQILQYCHSIKDIEAIAYQLGPVKLYHGAPTEFARMLVERGPRVPYRVEDVARHVASVYGLRWIEMAPFAYRKLEVVEMLSTAPAPIAVRWSWSFPLGEVLTDLNSHARYLVAALQMSRTTGMKLRDAMDDVMTKAEELARKKGIRYTIESGADILGLPDKFALEDKTGSLVEVGVNTMLIPQRYVEIVKHDYQDSLKYGESRRDILIWWNHTYRDIKVPKEAILSSNIVITGMEEWEQDAIEEEIKAGRLPPLPSGLEAR